MKTVTITLSFPIPVREEGCGYGDREDTMDWWETNPSPEDIAKNIKDYIESEHGGFAEYQTVMVQSVAITDA